MFSRQDVFFKNRFLELAGLFGTVCCFVLFRSWSGLLRKFWSVVVENF